MVRNDKDIHLLAWAAAAIIAPHAILWRRTELKLMKMRTHCAELITFFYFSQTTLVFTVFLYKLIHPSFLRQLNKLILFLLCFIH